MNAKGRRRVALTALLVALCVLPSTPAFGQSKQQLEKDKAKVEQELKKLSGDLSKAKKNSRNNQQQINLLDKKIGERTKLINNINGQLNLLGLQMTQTQDSITLMQSQVDSMKREYAHVVRVLYGERGALDKMVLLLDTKSYNTAYLRTKYTEYARRRRSCTAPVWTWRASSARPRPCWPRRSGTRTSWRASSVSASRT